MYRHTQTHNAHTRQASTHMCDYMLQRTVHALDNLILLFSYSGFWVCVCVRVRFIIIIFPFDFGLVCFCFVSQRIHLISICFGCGFVPFHPNYTTIELNWTELWASPPPFYLCCLFLFSNTHLFWLFISHPRSLARSSTQGTTIFIQLTHLKKRDSSCSFDIFVWFLRKFKCRRLIWFVSIWSRPTTKKTQNNEIEN